MEQEELSYGYSKILNQHDTNRNKSDYILPRLDFNSHFRVRLLSKREWRRDLVGEADTASIYTDRFKIDCGVEASLYFNDMDLSLSLSIDISNSAVYQTSKRKY